MTEKRSFFDWIIFLLIHICIIGGISVIAFYVYRDKLAVWVAVSATVAGLACTYLYAKDIPGEVPMKCMLYICVAANAGYMAHNGARDIGVKSYNAAQVEKYERGIAAAGKSTSRRVAKELGLSAERASQLEKTFSDGVSVTVAVLAFLELGMALIVFAISSKRLTKAETLQVAQSRSPEPTREEIEDLLERMEVRPTGRLNEGKGPRR